MNFTNLEDFKFELKKMAEYLTQATIKNPLNQNISRYCLSILLRPEPNI